MKISGKAAFTRVCVFWGGGGRILLSNKGRTLDRVDVRQVRIVTMLMGSALPEKRCTWLEPPKKRRPVIINLFRLTSLHSSLRYVWLDWARCAVEGNWRTCGIPNVQIHYFGVEGTAT